MKPATFGGSDGPAGAERAGRALVMAIDQRGTALLFEPERLKAVLCAAAPDALRAIDAILAAVANQVPQSMLGAHSDEHLAAVLPKLVERLLSTTPLDPAQASWIVRAWAKALALPAHGLDVAVSPAATSTAVAGADRRASVAEMLGPKAGPVPRVAVPASAAVAVEPVREAPDVLRAVVEAAPPDAERVAVAATAPSPPADRHAAIIQPVMPARRGSRLPLVVAGVLVLVAAIGFGAWRWTIARQPVATTAPGVDGKVADAPAMASPSPEPSSSSTATADRSDQALAAPPAAEPAAEPSPVPFAAPTPVAEEQPKATSSAFALSRSPARPQPSAPGPLAATAPARATVASAPAPARPGATAGQPAACTLASCGSVVAVRASPDEGPASAGAPTRGYEMTIRMDDRSIRTLTQSKPLATGSRVRMAGNGLAPIAP